MSNILKKIIQNKGKEVINIKSNIAPQNTHQSHGENFQKAFQEKTASIIGEVKLTSPSYDYSHKINYKKVIDSYISNINIKAISVLIDEKFFKGDITRIDYAKQNGKKPILFKEFIISTSQIDEAGNYGYDSILLMKKILSLSKLEDFIAYSQEKNIFPIVEVDNEEDLKSILKIPNQEFGIGINARNFDTLKVEIKIHFELYKKYEQPLKNRILFAFSGIKSYEEKDIKDYKGKYNGILIGTNLIKKMVEK